MNPKKSTDNSEQKQNTILAWALSTVFRFISFCIFACAGMAAIGAVILAKPLTIYYKDIDTVGKQEQILSDLKEIRDKRNDLIDNIEDPLVLEQAAIENLNYTSKEYQTAMAVQFDDATLWQDYSFITNKRNEAPATIGKIQIWAMKLNSDRTSQITLLALGSALIILSLTCFCREPAPSRDYTRLS